MFALRSAARAAALSSESRASLAFSKRVLSSKAVVGKDDDEDDGYLSPVEKKRVDLAKKNRHMVWESPEADHLPAAPLPEDPKELTAIDSTDLHVRQMADGSDRMVIIRQDQANVKQAPIAFEKNWTIAFIEDGAVAEKWTNSLMNWATNADPYHTGQAMQFETAAEAVYLAKKRGWNYVVQEPTRRPVPMNGTQYQDNFLPRTTTAQMKKDRKQCDLWKRSAAGTSHYFRPLRYHGEGVVPQHGPNGEDESMVHVEGYYKRR